MLIVGTFLLGLIIGSFLNVLIIRGYRREKANGRSRCMHCGKILETRELIPIASFLAQKGRCRNCGIALSWQYPLVELTTAVLFAFSAWYVMRIFKYLNIETAAILLASWIVIAAAIHIFVTDLRWQIIPNGAVLIFLIIGFARIGYQFSQAKLGIFPSLAWDIGIALTTSLLLTALWFFSRGRAIGLGDAKLIFATSLLLGFPNSIVAFLFSFWLGGLVGVLLLIAGRKKLKSQIPFGPFILIGSTLAYFFGPIFLEYTNLSLFL